MADFVTTASEKPPVPETESQLIADAVAGDPKALDALVKSHQSRVAALAHRLLGWPGDVDDVVQDAFVAMFEGLPRFRGRCRLSTWLFRITVNTCRRHRRRRALTKITPRLRMTVAGAPESRPSAALTRRETTGRIRAALEALRPRDREVVVLRYFEALSMEDIAEILGIRRNAAEARLSRARERLRNLLGGLVED
jgi:RNA polymerase sigma-70 factor (ECF subfamily)